MSYFQRVTKWCKRLGNFIEQRTELKKKSIKWPNWQAQLIKMLGVRKLSWFGTRGLPDGIN